MKILVTGVNGMLGSKIASSLVTNPSNNVFGLARKKATEIPNVNYTYQDLTNQEALRNNVDTISPDVIIHCAANVNISDCENNKEQAFSLHVETSKTLALCNVNTRIIYISTDSVYNGISGNYNESDPTGPVNYYAQTKLLGEQAVLENNSNSMVVRTNMYGFSRPMRSSLAEWAITKLAGGEQISGFDDVFFNPLYTAQIAECMPAFIGNRYTGIINFGTTEHISKYDFLLKLAEVFNFNKDLIVKSSISNVEALKDRPKNTTLDTGYLNKEWNISFSIDEGILLMYEDFKKAF